MTRALQIPLISFAMLAATSSSASAALIAQYLFEGNGNDSSGSASTYNLATVGAAPAFQANVVGNTTSAYVSDGNPANYLDAGMTVGGSAQYTVSIWINTTNLAQAAGDNQGIFSNNDDFAANNSWQVALGDSGGYEFKATIDGQSDPRVTREEFIGSPTSGVWENIVIQKTGGNDGQIWFNGVQVGGDLGYNPGGLQFFRVGINRSSDSSFDGFIDSIQIWEGENVSAATIYANGVNVVPEPSSALILGTIWIAACFSRRRP